MRASLGALEHRQFRLLWLGQTASALGDSLVPVALAFAVIELTGSASDLGFVLAAGLVPRVVLVLAGGVWADRLPRQLVMLSSDVVRGVAHTTIAVLLLTGSAEVWHLAVLSALFGVGFAFFSPASTGLVPQLVPPEHLQSANALRSLSTSTCWMLGPAIAGAIVATSGAGWAFVIDAATFVVSIVFLARMRIGFASAPVETRSFVRELREGWRELTAHAWLWVSIVEFSLWNLAIAPVWVLGPLVAASALDGPASWGAIATCAGVGSIAGALFAIRVRPPRPLVAINLGCLVCPCLPLALAGELPTAAIAATALACLGAIAFANAVWETTLQQGVSARAVSRVSAYDWMGSLLLHPVGLAIAGPISGAVGVGPTLVGCAAVMGGTTLAALVVPGVRGLHRGQLQPSAEPLAG